ncbi:MAG TPA: D-arabinono-1,4-lactone oxidase [Mycobacteriales bacterium]|nr:D-arabinono-1,4-lactone oxidase [Mycobacteriales bacterium]
MTSPGWQNWGRNQAVTPREVAVARDVEAVSRVVGRAAADGRTVRAVGSGHSFTATALAPDIQLRLDGLDRILAVDRDSGVVTAGAAITLRRLNAELDAAGLSMSNLGDIDAQTLAGAISTGTHGTGARLGGIATQVRGLQLVLADGSVAEVSAQADPELYAAARVGLGAFGVVTAVTLQCEPRFELTAVEQPMPLEQVLEEFDALADGNEHFEFYWFPHTEVALTKRNNRPKPGEALTALPRWRELLDDELLSNGVFEAAQRFVYRRPSSIPALNRLSAKALSARTFTDVSHRVFVSPRRVRFREMEYAVPRDRLVAVFREVRDWIERSGATISFPVEVRVAAPDDIWLSTAQGRASGYLAVHQWHRVDYEPYFRAVEAIATAADGRPHWGKLHWLGPAALRERYPHFDDAMTVRDRVDPDRVFSNVYTTQVFGS